MTVADAASLQRNAQELVVEMRRAYSSPPRYSRNWRPVWAAKVDRIEVNRDASPSVAAIWFPDSRWDDPANPRWADMVRIRTNEAGTNYRTILFVGFVTRRASGFSGGDEASQAYERNAFICHDFRWLLAALCPIAGQVARGPDDYTGYGTVSQAPKTNSYTWLTARRAIFNPDGVPNRDPDLLIVTDSTGGSVLCQTPVFANPSDDTDLADAWTARDMVRYLLSPIINLAYDYLPIEDPNLLVGLDHSDWDKVLNNIVVEGLNIIDALQIIAHQLGWCFREEYTNNGLVSFAFYERGGAAGYVRSTSTPTMLHALHAPAVNEDLAAAVAAGKKLLWAMQLDQDISSLVNTPWSLGAPDRFEFTAELVPAWYDSDLSPDTSDSLKQLYFTEADLQDITDPDTYSYYKRYHPRGSQFLRDVGRKWVLNESATYTLSPYDRGPPFDFATVVPAEYILDAGGKRLYAPFDRQLLPCLSVDKRSLNSIGIVVQFSFDAGTTWQVIPASVISLDQECGLHISEANLAELVDKNEQTISGGTLDGKQLNYWTSLCGDKLAARSFKNGQWLTRIRVTASIQMDIRLGGAALPSARSGSPFLQALVYDFSSEYGRAKRTLSSAFFGTEVREVDSTVAFGAHLDAIRKANEDMSISGQFMLERLWLGDGRGVPDFMIGDSIERITGREYPLGISFGGSAVYPEIVQIVYLPDKQKMWLLTRDLRFATVAL